MGEGDDGCLPPVCGLSGKDGGLCDVRGAGARWVCEYQGACQCLCPGFGCLAPDINTACPLDTHKPILLRPSCGVMPRNTKTKHIHSFHACFVSWPSSSAWWYQVASTGNSNSLNH